MRETERGGHAVGWLAAAMRAGHAAKGTIYAATAALGLWHAVRGANVGGGAREAVRVVAEAPFGKGVIAILAVGMAAFALSRLTLAVLDPEGAGWRTRALHLGAAALNAALVVFLVHLLLGGEAAAAEGPTRLARTLARPRGRWIVAGFGAALLVRGIVRLVRPPRDELTGRIESLGLSSAASVWMTRVGSTARVARGTILLAVGGGLVYAAAVRAPTAGPPWIGGVLGCCLLAQAVNEWIRARYRLPWTPRIDPSPMAEIGPPAGATISPPAARTSPTRPAAPACTDPRRTPRSGRSGPRPSG
jgi:hypothetical protein